DLSFLLLRFSNCFCKISILRWLEETLKFKQKQNAGDICLSKRERERERVRKRMEELTGKRDVPNPWWFVERKEFAILSAREHTRWAFCVAKPDQFGQLLATFQQPNPKFIWMMFLFSLNPSILVDRRSL